MTANTVLLLSSPLLSHSYNAQQVGTAAVEVVAAQLHEAPSHSISIDRYVMVAVQAWSFTAALVGPP
jgi:hypothetical protein